MTLAIEVRAKPGKANELYQTLQALLPTLRKEKGCLVCRVSRSKEPEEVYALTCEWDAKASCEAYIRSISGSALIGALELLAESARIRLGEDSKWEGLEALKRIRKEN